MSGLNKDVSVSAKAMIPTYGNGSSITDKFLAPIIAEKEYKRSLTPEERCEYIKRKYNLHHGKGKRKRKNKKKKGR